MLHDTQLALQRLVRLLQAGQHPLASLRCMQAEYDAAEFIGMDRACGQFRTVDRAGNGFVGQDIARGDSDRLFCKHIIGWQRRQAIQQAHDIVDSRCFAIASAALRTTCGS